MSGSITDGKLVELYLARRDAASELSMEKYGARLLRLAMTFLSDRRDAEECVNETFLKAWNAIPPNEPAELFPFLARICRCTAYDMIKMSKTAKRCAQVVELTNEMEECIPDELSKAEIPDEELSGLLNDFLETISRDNRAVFVRRYWFCENVSEIAARYGFSESKVKTSLHRTRIKLKKYLFMKGVSL